MRIYANDPRFRQPVIEALAYELTLQENRIRVEEISIALRKASRTMLWSIGKVCLWSWNLYHHRAADVKLLSRLRCSFSIPFFYGTLSCIKQSFFVAITRHFCYLSIIVVPFIFMWMWRCMQGAALDRALVDEVHPNQCTYSTVSERSALTDQ